MPEILLCNRQIGSTSIESQCGVSIKASHGLSGGGGLMGLGACGALTGGLMAISAKFGRDRNKLDSGRCINNFKKSRDLVERFRQEFGGITCEDL